MKKFEEFMAESLASEIKKEPKTAASKQAKQLGLTYAGFGRYADRKGNITYIVHDDKLVPYKNREALSSMYSKTFDMTGGPASKEKKIKGAKEASAKPDKGELARKTSMFYNKVMDSRESKDRNILHKKTSDAVKYKKELEKFYQKHTFDDNEVEAIEWYTEDGFEYINRYLYKGHDEGASYSDDVEVKKAIAKLDSAFEGTEAPFNYTTYTGLSSRYSSSKFKPGNEYIFRGYVSTSLNYETAIDGFAQTDFNDKAVILQVDVKKGQKSIYVDAMSSNQGEGETLLPRGSRIKVLSGPHPIENSLISANSDEGYIHLFHCEIVEDK